MEKRTLHSPTGTPRVGSERVRHPELFAFTKNSQHMTTHHCLILCIGSGHTLADDEHEAIMKVNGLSQKAKTALEDGFVVRECPFRGVEV